MKVYYIFNYQVNHYTPFKTNIILSDEKLTSIISSELKDFKNIIECSNYIKELKSVNKVNLHNYIEVNKVSELRLNNIKKNIFNMKGEF